MNDKPVAYITPEQLLELLRNHQATVYAPGYQPYKVCVPLYLTPPPGRVNPVEEPDYHR